VRLNYLVVLVLVSVLFFSVFEGITPVRAGFDLSNVEYYDHVRSVLALTPEQESMLGTYGFVSVNVSHSASSEMSGGPDLRFEDFYFDEVYANDMPVFVTTDSILQLFHVVFDCSLRMLEKQVFYQMVLNFTQFAYSASLGDYNSVAHDNSEKYWAIRNSTVYFAVALSLLTNQTLTLPSELSNDVGFFLNNIYAQEPSFLTAGEWHMPAPPYSVTVYYDFTQFTVRGHYLGDPVLEEYFRTLMWYGQYAVFIPRNDEQYVWSAPHFDEPSMVYMADLFKSNPQCYENWMKLYNATAILVGDSDSINPMNLEVALQKVFGNENQYFDNFIVGNGQAALTEELSKPEYQQQILSQGLVSQFQDVVLSRYPMVFQFMGQRYVPDSYIFQMLSWDKVGLDANGARRILPKGLDVFAVLGSERASQLLTPDMAFENFSTNMAALQQDFQNLTEENWTKSSYTAWIYTLQSLVQGQGNDSFPEFMTNPAWQDEKLNTALGSWAELRHDTLLYAKQTYIPGTLCSYPEAFVEPYPSFYTRMQLLVQRTMDAVNVLDPASVDPAITSSLQTLNSTAAKLGVISAKELAKEMLTSDETNFIETLAWSCGSGGDIGWYVDTVHNIAEAANYTSILNAPLIADVATFPPGDIEYPPQILHVGVGYVNALVVLFPLPNGAFVAAVGPVFTYYEFPLIGTKRLNDDEWMGMLSWNNITAYLPSQLEDVEAFAAPMTPEYPTFIVPVAMTAIVLVAVVARKRFKARARSKREIRKGTQIV
jgi:hypothetical protein